MGRDKQAQRDAVTEKDIRSENTRIADALEGATGVGSKESYEEEVQDPLESAETLDGEVSYRSSDLKGDDLREEGIPNDPNNTERKVEDYLIEHLGYDPDRGSYATVGDVDVNYNRGLIEVSYSLNENLISADGSSAPLLNEVEPDVLKTILSADAPHPEIRVFADGQNRAQFIYDEEDWIIATEEIGDTINNFEDDLEL